MRTSRVASMLMFALMAGASAPVAFAQAKDITVTPGKGVIAYAIDQRGVVARNATGLCWRTGYWTPQAAAEIPEVGCVCDKDLLPKEKCEPPAPPPVAAPAPAPAPVPAPAPAAPPPAPKKCDFATTLQADETFDFNKATLKSAAKAKLDNEVIAKLGTCASVTQVLVTGHTDRLGSQQYNQKLSEKRAAAVATYLQGKGVKADVVETMGAGKTQPVPGVKCDDKLPRKKLIECLAPNRRVVVDVKGPGK